MIIYILIFLLLIFISFKLLHAIYIFQIKEYRFDRFFSALKEWGIGETVYLHKPRLPAKSLRNILLFLWGIISLGLVVFFLEQNNIIFDIFLIFLSPLIAFAWIGFGVWMTQFFALYKRKQIIAEAKTFLMNQPHLIRVGITGCFGKTTTKEFLSHVLSSQFSVAKTQKNWNTDVGVALSTLSQIKNETNYFVAEAGGYKKGEIGAIAKWLKPTYGFFTGMGNQHLDLYGSPEALKEGETELLAALPSEGKAYINIDTPETAYVKNRCHCQTITYSFSNHLASIYFSDYVQEGDMQKAHVHYKGNVYALETYIIGKHLCTNLLPVIAFGLDQGMKWEAIHTAILQLRPIHGKLSLHKGINGATFLNDAANTNVDGFIAAIETMAHMDKKKKYIISKGIIELGSQKKDSYKKIVDHLDQRNIILITTDFLFPKVAKNTEKIIVCKNESDFIHFLKQNADTDTLITLEGRFSPSFIAHCFS